MFRICSHNIWTGTPSITTSLASNIPVLTVHDSQSVNLWPHQALDQAIKSIADIGANGRNGRIAQQKTALQGAPFKNPLNRRDQTKNCPPLAEIVDPVMKPASSEARNTTQRAISSGSPRRPTGICGIMRSFSTFSGTARTISVPI